MNSTLILGKSILINKEFDIYVHQPTVDDIDELGEDNFDILPMPFVITMKALYSADADKYIEMNNKFHIYELFFEKAGKNEFVLDNYFKGNTIEVLINALKFFLKEDSITALESRRKLIITKKDGKEYMIDNDEFDIIRAAIQKVVMKSDIKPRDVKHDNARISDNERKKREFEERQAKRKGNKKSELASIINMVAHGGDSYIEYSKIREMTYFQLMTSYHSISSKVSYNHLIGYELSSEYKLKEKVKHWIDDVMLKK